MPLPMSMDSLAMRSHGTSVCGQTRVKESSLHRKKAHKDKTRGIYSKAGLIVHIFVGHGRGWKDVTEGEWIKVSG